MSGCYGSSFEDRHFERELFDHLSQKAYCEKHDLEWDESKGDDCPKCQEEYDNELFHDDFDPGNPKIFKED
jgi:hypothetical protein